MIVHPGVRPLQLLTGAGAAVKINVPKIRFMIAPKKFTLRSRRTRGLLSNLSARFTEGDPSDLDSRDGRFD